MQQHEQRRGPPELIEHDGLEEAAGAEKHRAQGDGEAGGELGESPAAEAAGSERGEQHDERCCDGREEPNCQQGSAERRERGAAGEGNERWKVHAPEVEMPGHGEIEEFVAVEAVGGDAVDDDVEQEDGDGEGEAWSHPGVPRSSGQAEASRARTLWRGLNLRRPARRHR